MDMEEIRQETRELRKAIIDMHVLHEKNHGEVLNSINSLTASVKSVIDAMAKSFESSQKIAILEHKLTSQESYITNLHQALKDLRVWKDETSIRWAENSVQMGMAGRGFWILMAALTSIITGLSVWGLRGVL